MGSFLEENFITIAQSKLRMKIKSHCYLRYSIALPRDRNNNCPFCPIERESTNHILFQCQKYCFYTKKIIAILNKYFQLNIQFDDTVLIKLNGDKIINVFQMINQRAVWNARCSMLHVGIVLNDAMWENLFLTELERYLWKELFSSIKIEEDESEMFYVKRNKVHEKKNGKIPLLCLFYVIYLNFIFIFLDLNIYIFFYK